MTKPLLLLLFLAGCQLPAENGTPLKVDAYSAEIPADKTAVVRLQNKIIRQNSLEYRDFYPKLKAVLTEKGYRIVSENQPHAVVLKLYFGVRRTNYWNGRYSIGKTSKPSAYSDDVFAQVLSVYKKTNLYSKFLRVVAVDAGNPKRELWKVTAVKEDEAEDFRSAQYELLYLFSRYAERDSLLQIRGNLSGNEVYQRFIRKVSPAQTDMTAYLPMELKSDYQKWLQNKVNACAKIFVPCGLKAGTWARFELSAFGTVEFFETNADSERAKSCLAETLESLVLAPVGIPKDETYTVVIPPP